MNRQNRQKFGLMILFLPIIFFIYQMCSNNNQYSKYATYFSKYSNKIIKKYDNVAIVTYAAGKASYFANKTALMVSAHDHGIDRILTYSPNDIDINFYQKNAHILDQKRGAGFWLWKPYIILNAMKRLPKNSIIFYIDGDYFIIKDPFYLINLAQKYDRVLFKNLHTNAKYVKRDAYILMNVDEDKFYNATQLEAGLLIIKNTAKNEKFVQKWLDYALDERILTDKPSTLGKELLEFTDHRHDQAILSLLSIQHQDQVYIEYKDIHKFIHSHNSKNNLFILNKYINLFNTLHQ